MYFYLNNEHWLSLQYMKLSADTKSCLFEFFMQKWARNLRLLIVDTK